MRIQRDSPSKEVDDLLSGIVVSPWATIANLKNIALLKQLEVSILARSCSSRILQKTIRDLGIARKGHELAGIAEAYAPFFREQPALLTWFLSAADNLEGCDLKQRLEFFFAPSPSQQPSDLAPSKIRPANLIPLPAPWKVENSVGRQLAFALDLLVTSIKMGDSIIRRMPAPDPLLGIVLATLMETRNGTEALPLLFSNLSLCGFEVSVASSTQVEEEEKIISLFHLARQQLCFLDD